MIVFLDAVAPLGKAALGDETGVVFVCGVFPEAFAWKGRGSKGGKREMARAALPGKLVLELQEPAWTLAPPFIAGGRGGGGGSM